MRWTDSIKEPQAECAGAEQGCWGLGAVDVTHSEGRPESEPTQQYVTHTRKLKIAHVTHPLACIIYLFNSTTSDNRLTFSF